MINSVDPKNARESVKKIYHNTRLNEKLCDHLSKCKKDLMTFNPYLGFKITLISNKIETENNFFNLRQSIYQNIKQRIFLMVKY